MTLGPCTQPSYGLAWLRDTAYTACPKNCHNGVTAADAVTYAEGLRTLSREDPRPLLRAYFMGEAIPASATSAVPSDLRHHFLMRQNAWTELRRRVVDMIRERGETVRPAAVHSLGDLLLDIAHLKGRVQRRKAIAELNSRYDTLAISTRRTLDDTVAVLKRQEVAIAHWVAAELSTALGKSLDATDWGLVGDLLKHEGAVTAAGVAYAEAHGGSTTPSERLFFQAQVLECRAEESSLGPDESLRTEVARAYHETHASIQSAAAPQLPVISVDGVTTQMTVGHSDQLHIAAVILGRLYHSVLLQDETPDDRALSILESELHHHLTTRASLATLPEAVRVSAFAQAVAQRYAAPGGVLSRQHVERDVAIASTVARVQELVQLTESFGPSDAVSAAVLDEARAQLAWMGQVDARRRAGRPWEALQAIPVLESRYAQTDSFKKFKLALYREAPQHFTADIKFLPQDVATQWEGVAAAAQEGSRSLDIGSSPWRRFFVDTGTTLTGAGVGLAAGGPPGAAIGAVVGGAYGEAGNVAITAAGDRDAIAQSARAGLSDVSPRAAQAALGVWGGSLMLGSALRALGGWGLGSSMISRFGTTAPIRTAMQRQLTQPGVLWRAIRANPAGLLWGTSNEGRELLWRNYWFKLGFMAVGVDTVGLHRQESGHTELRCDGVPDTWVGMIGIGLMLASPQTMALFYSAGRSHLARWWGTEMVRYPWVLARASLAGIRGLAAPAPAAAPAWTQAQWREGLRQILRDMPHLSGRHMSQWTLEEWWDVGTRLRALNTGMSVESILTRETADFQTFRMRLAPWDVVKGEQYWWDGWRHARLSNMTFPIDHSADKVTSVYKLAHMDISTAAQAAKSPWPVAIRQGMDTVFGGLNAIVDQVTRWEVRAPAWESGHGLLKGLKTLRWEIPDNVEGVGWNQSMGFLQSARFGKIHAWLNGRFDAAAQAVRTTVPEFSEVLKTPAIAKEADVSANMVGRKGFADLMSQVFGGWSTTRTEKYPTIALIVESGKAFMSAEFIRAHRLGGIVTLGDGLSDGKLDSWSGFFAEMAMWNYVTELLGFSTTGASDIGTAIYVFTQAQLRKYSGESLLDQDPNMLRPAFYQFHAGFFYMRLVSGIHAPGMRFMDGLPFVRDTFPSISSVPPALRVGVEMDKVNFRTPLGYLWSVAVPPASMGIALGDYFRTEKLADASGYYGTRALLKFVFSAVILNPRQVRQGYITSLATLEARFWGYLADLGLNKFADSFIGKQLFNKVVADMLASDDLEALDAVWDKFCETNTTLSMGGRLSVRDKREGEQYHPLQFGYRWEPTGLDAWQEWDHGRFQREDNPKKDRRGYFEKLVDGEPEKLQRLVKAYQRQLEFKTATWRSTGNHWDSRAPFYFNPPNGSGFDLQTRDAMGIVVFAMMAKYYAWKATQGQIGWTPFVHLVNSPQYSTFWDAVPEFHSRSELNHQVELMNDRQWDWQSVLQNLHISRVVSEKRLQ